MSDQQDACSKPCVLVTSGSSVAVPARASAADEVYSFWGYTPHFEIYIAESLLGIAVPLAEAIKETCEDDHERLRHHFGGLTPDDLPFRVYITPGFKSAHHSSCADTGLYCEAFNGSTGPLMRCLVVAEADEVFMDSQGRGWLCDCSNGEGLSRVLAEDASPPGAVSFFTAGKWLNSERTDFVSTIDGSDTHDKSTGCSTLFLYYLKSQLGFSWPQIVQAGAYLPLDKQFPSLANTNTNLTGRTDAFDSFYSLVTRRFPYGVQAELRTDNPFPIKPDLLFYARSAGVGQLYATNLAGDIGLLSTYTDWRTTWTLIVPMHFSRARHSDVLFYNASAGLGELYSTNGLGELNPIVRRYTNWRTTWSIILAGSFTGNGFSDLLFYARAAGIGEFYRTDKHGNLTLLTSHTDWLTTWSQIVAGNFSRSDSSDLLFYEPTAGVPECWTVDAYGNVAFLNSTPTSHTWSIILPLNVTGSPFSDLLCYDAANGLGELFTSDGDGGPRHVKSFAGWRTNWSVILSPSFGQLLFYSAESGVSQFYEMDPHGTMTLRRTFENWRTDWSLIHTGNFADHI
jgi:hypothetical protein